MNTFGSDHRVKGFKGLSRKETGWSKPPYMRGKMKNHMKLALVEPLRSPFCCAEKKLVDLCLEICLRKEHET